MIIDFGLPSLLPTSSNGSNTVPNLGLVSLSSNFYLSNTSLDNGNIWPHSDSEYLTKLPESVLDINQNKDLNFQSKRKKKNLKLKAKRNMYENNETSKQRIKETTVGNNEKVNHELKNLFTNFIKRNTVKNSNLPVNSNLLHKDTYKKDELNSNFGYQNQSKILKHKSYWNDTSPQIKRIIRKRRKRQLNRISSDGMTIITNFSTIIPLNDGVPSNPIFTLPDKVFADNPYAKIGLLWSAISIALSLEIQNLVGGLPCITRFNQLFCRSGGKRYPSDQIDRFIDDNRALIRRMHGNFDSPEVQNGQNGRTKRKVDPLKWNPKNSTNFYDNGTQSSFTEDIKNLFQSSKPDPDLKKRQEGSFRLNHQNEPPSKSNPYINVIRTKRQTPSVPSEPLPSSPLDRTDVCESDDEVATPYWASNSKGKILAIVNNQEFSQIIHQEICTLQTTERCQNDCGCEQKYKYHRLMAYDPEDECKGIFMDWFLFPSCCSCRCDPISPGSGFLNAIVQAVPNFLGQNANTQNQAETNVANGA